jgi:steroid delta-isomerase-like uncharacterized protein
MVYESGGFTTFRFHTSCALSSAFDHQETDSARARPAPSHNRPSSVQAETPGKAWKHTGMSREQNIEATKRFGELVNTGQLDSFAEVVAPDSVDHDPAPGQGPGPLGFTAFFTTMRAAFPDLNIAVEHMLADEDNVSFAYTITGTHQGVFMGVPPTGKAIKVRGMQIGRFENGMMVERWGSSDELGLLSQLGIDLPGRS